MQVDVGIIGLGPVGATLANLLGDQGLTVAVFERDTEVYPLPRAAHFDHEIMRVWQSLGLAQAMHHAARPAPAYEFRNAAGEILLRYALEEARGPGGWAPSWMFNQPDLERALRARLTRQPQIAVHLGTTVTTCREAGNKVRLEMTGPNGAGTLDASYVVACDGASSPTRKMLGIALDDLGFDEPWLVIDAKLKPGAVVPDTNLQICDPVRPTTCVLMGPGRHRWEFMAHPHETPEEMLNEEKIAALLAPWIDTSTLTIDRKAVYRFHALVAKKWRDGRVLLCGDAAHQTPPFLGQGMCAGIRDAVNLAWKLARVVRGESAPTILDTYQTEREPHVRTLIAMAIAMGRVVCTQDPAEAAARDAAMLAERAKGIDPLPPPDAAMGEGLWGSGPRARTMMPQPVAGEHRLDDVLGPGPWLIRPPGETPHPPDDLIRRDIATDDASLTPFRAQLGAWLDGKAALIRADRYVFATGEAEALRREFRRALT